MGGGLKVSSWGHSDIKRSRVQQEAVYKTTERTKTLQSFNSTKKVQSQLGVGMSSESLYSESWPTFLHFRMLPRKSLSESLSVKEDPFYTTL